MINEKKCRLDSDGQPEVVPGREFKTMQEIGRAAVDRMVDAIKHDGLAPSTWEGKLFLLVNGEDFVVTVSIDGIEEAWRADQ